MIKNILFSLVKTVIVSGLLTGLGHYIFKYPLVDTFIVVTILQFVLFYFWNSYIQVTLQKNAAAEETSRIETFYTQGVDAPCAYCNHINYVPVRMDRDNNFECEACGKGNAMYVEVTVAQQATPLEKQALSISSYIQDKIDATEKIKRS